MVTTRLELESSPKFFTKPNFRLHLHVFIMSSSFHDQVSDMWLKLSASRKQNFLNCPAHTNEPLLQHVTEALTAVTRSAGPGSVSEEKKSTF